MKAALLSTGSGPLIIMTSHTSLTAPTQLVKLTAKSIDKVKAYNLPMETAQQRYVHEEAVVS